MVEYDRYKVQEGYFFPLHKIVLNTQNEYTVSCVYFMEIFTINKTKNIMAKNGRSSNFQKYFTSGYCGIMDQKMFLS